MRLRVPKFNMDDAQEMAAVPPPVLGSCLLASLCILALASACGAAREAVRGTKLVSRAVPAHFSRMCKEGPVLWALVILEVLVFCQGVPPHILIAHAGTAGYRLLDSLQIPSRINGFISSMLWPWLAASCPWVACGVIALCATLVAIKTLTVIARTASATIAVVAAGLGSLWRQQRLFWSMLVSQVALVSAIFYAGLQNNFLELLPEVLAFIKEKKLPGLFLGPLMAAASSELARHGCFWGMATVALASAGMVVADVIRMTARAFKRAHRVMLTTCSPRAVFWVMVLAEAAVACVLLGSFLPQDSWVAGLSTSIRETEVSQVLDSLATILSESQAIDCCVLALHTIMVVSAFLAAREVVSLTIRGSRLLLRLAVLGWQRWQLLGAIVASTLAFLGVALIIQDPESFKMQIADGYGQLARLVAHLAVLPPSTLLGLACAVGMGALAAVSAIKVAAVLVRATVSLTAFCLRWLLNPWVLLFTAALRLLAATASVEWVTESSQVRAAWETMPRMLHEQVTGIMAYGTSSIPQLPVKASCQLLMLALMASSTCLALASVAQVVGRMGSFLFLSTLKACTCVRRSKQAAWTMAIVAAFPLCSLVAIQLARHPAVHGWWSQFQQEKLPLLLDLLHPVTSVSKETAWEGGFWGMAAVVAALALLGTWWTLSQLAHVGPLLLTMSAQGIRRAWRSPLLLPVVAHTMAWSLCAVGLIQAVKNRDIIYGGMLVMKNSLVAIFDYSLNNLLPPLMKFAAVLLPGIALGCCFCGGAAAVGGFIFWVVLPGAEKAVPHAKLFAHQASGGLQRIGRQQKMFWTQVFVESASWSKATTTKHIIPLVHAARKSLAGLRHKPSQAYTLLLASARSRIPQLAKSAARKVGAWKIQLSWSKQGHPLMQRWADIRIIRNILETWGIGKGAAQAREPSSGLPNGSSWAPGHEHDFQRNWAPGTLYQLMEVQGDLLDGSLVEKLVIPRGHIARLCNDAVPGSCDDQATRLDFGALDGVAQVCYGVVGNQRGAILSLLANLGVLGGGDGQPDDEGQTGELLHRSLLEAAPPGLYGMVMREKQAEEKDAMRFMPAFSNHFRAPTGQLVGGDGITRQVVFVVLWPRPDAFSSISPNSISSSCVRYITQLTRHVFFCFDRPGTLAFPSGEQCALRAVSRLGEYKIAERQTHEKSFSVQHRSFSLDTIMGANNTSNGVIPHAPMLSTGVPHNASTYASILVRPTGGQSTPGAPQTVTLFGARGLAGVVHRRGTHVKAMWKQGIWVDLEAGNKSDIAKWKREHRVVLHPDMPAEQRRLVLETLASDTDLIRATMRRQEHELQRLREQGELEAGRWTQGLERRQEEFGKLVLRAFYHRVVKSERIAAQLAFAPSILEEACGLIGDADDIMARVHEQLGNESVELEQPEQLFQGLVRDLECREVLRRCCLVGAIVDCPAFQDTRGFLQKLCQGPLLREPPEVEAHKLWLQGAGHLQEAATREGLMGKSFMYETNGYPVKSPGGQNEARCPERVRQLLATLASKVLAERVQRAEGKIREQLAHGYLDLGSRARRQAQLVKERGETETRQLAARHADVLELMALEGMTDKQPGMELGRKPGVKAGETGGWKPQAVVKHCKLLTKAAAFGGHGHGRNKKETTVLSLEADVEEPGELHRELQVSLLSLPQSQPGEVSPGHATEGHCTPTLTSRGNVLIPETWSVVSLFLFKKGGSLLLVANAPDGQIPEGRTQLSIFNFSAGGQRVFHQTFGKHSVLADFDEETRLVAFSGLAGKTNAHVISIHRFDDKFSKLGAACQPLELSLLNGSAELRDMKLLRTQRKLVMLDAGGRVRVYNVQQKTMESYTFQDPAAAGPSTQLLVTSTGNFVMLLSLRVDDRTNARVTRGRSAAAAAAPAGPTGPLCTTPLMMPGLEPLPPVHIDEHSGAAPDYVAFSLGGGEGGADAGVEYVATLSSAGEGRGQMIVAHRVIAQTGEQAQQIEAVTDGSGAHQADPSASLTALEYLFYAYDKFAVVGAAVRSDTSHRGVAGMHVAVVLDGEPGMEVDISGRVAAYLKGIEERLLHGCKPGVEDLGLVKHLVVVPTAGELDRSWVVGGGTIGAPAGSNVDVDSLKRSWLASASQPQQMGCWVKQLICLLPLQIARAVDNSFVLMRDGTQMTQTLHSTEEAVNAISFGLLDAVLESWRGDVVVVSSMGKQSTGKSYTLNHLFGTSFQISGARCTDGCWMGLCQVGAVLYVILDFEGLGSFERTEQEDMLLSVFNAAISNCTLFKTEFRLDRDLERLFARFQGGMGLLKGDARLFRGCFCIVVKDVADRDVKAINQEFNSKIALITRSKEGEQGLAIPDNFIKSMYGGEYAIVPFPPLGSEKFYLDLEDLFQIIAERPRQFTSGGAIFAPFMKQVMAKLRMKDWSALQGKEDSATRVLEYLTRHLDAAICLGHLDRASDGLPEERRLVCLNTGQPISVSALALGATWTRQWPNVRVPDVGDGEVILREDGTAQQKLIQKLLDMFQKRQAEGVGRMQWDKAFPAFVRAIVERRCSSIQEWAEVNLMHLHGEGGQLNDCGQQFTNEVKTKLQALRNEWQLCGSTCSKCFMSCLLPKSHPAGKHDCMGTHACPESCSFCAISIPGRSAATKKAKQSNSSKLLTCADKMGHAGDHCCEDVDSHICKAACSLAGSLNCKSTCCKKVGHDMKGGAEATHICDSPLHIPQKAAISLA
eukprot:jgi/Mesvir1/20789/Mv07899-RA.2